MLCKRRPFDELARLKRAAHLLFPLSNLAFHSAINKRLISWLYLSSFQLERPAQLLIDSFVTFLFFFFVAVYDDIDTVVAVFHSFVLWFIKTAGNKVSFHFKQGQIKPSASSTQLNCASISINGSSHWKTEREEQRLFQTGSRIFRHLKTVLLPSRWDWRLANQLLLFGRLKQS